WEVGPLVANDCADPTTDTTSTSDNRAAGVAIYPSTGCASTVAHNNFYYLTPPVIDTSNLPRAWLTFPRWLRSDYPPYMVSTIEVYNGSSWVVIWQNPDFTYILDTTWTKLSYDLTMYKNAGMRVRWDSTWGLSRAPWDSGPWTTCRSPTPSV